MTKIYIEVEVEDTKIPHNEYKSQVLLNSLEYVSSVTAEKNVQEKAIWIKARVKHKYVRCDQCKEVFIMRKDGQPVRHNGCH